MKLKSKLVNAAVAVALTPIAGFAEDAVHFMPDCYRAATPDTGMLTFETREGPYKVALVNGFFGIPWRNQMIQSLKAWSERPEAAQNIEELTIVSVGSDVAAQIAAVDNFIQAGYDAIIFIAVNPTSFDAVQLRAERAGTLLISFDNTVDSEKMVGIQPSQIELSMVKAQGVVDLIPNQTGTIVEVRGVVGNATDRDRHIGQNMVFDQYPGIEVIEVVGNWDQGEGQKVVADVLATHGEIDGIVSQHGSAGPIRAMLAAGHPMVPVGGDGENSFRLAMYDNNVPGVSVEGSPGMSAVAMQAAFAMLQGYAIPESVNLPIIPTYGSDLVAGENVFPDVAPSYNTVSGYEECGITFTPDELNAFTPEAQ